MVVISKRDYWLELQSFLRIGRYQNWTLASGARDSFFNLIRITSDRIKISVDGSSIPRTVTQAEINRVAEFWPAYKQGNVSRLRLRDISQNSTYVITLLHEIDPD